jgi:hypothetical protein
MLRRRVTLRLRRRSTNVRFCAALDKSGAVTCRILRARSMRTAFAAEALPPPLYGPPTERRAGEMLACRFFLQLAAAQPTRGHRQVEIEHAASDGSHLKVLWCSKRQPYRSDRYRWIKRCSGQRAGSSERPLRARGYRPPTSAHCETPRSSGRCSVPCRCPGVWS